MKNEKKTPPLKKNYDIDRATASEAIKRIESLFNKNDNPKEKEHLLWQYIKPENGSITSISVAENGNDAAVYSVFKVKAKIQSEMGYLYQSLDTLTDKNHRGKGLFGKLANDVYDQCNINDKNIVYGFPNSSSAPVFFSKLGWQELGHPPFMFFINNLLFPVVYLTKKKLFIENKLLKILLNNSLSNLLKKTGYSLNNKDDFSTDYDSIWQEFSRDLKTTIWRDSHYMNWRYKNKPNNKYKYISLYENQNLIGKLIYTIEEKHNGKIGYIMDVICYPDHKFAPEILLKKATIDIIEERADIILAWIPETHYLFKSFKKSKFFKLPRKLQPIKLFFGYRPENNSKLKIQNTDFFISYSDSDTV